MRRPPLPSLWRGARLGALLFVLTVLSVYLAGGTRLVLGLVSILLAHEMGHYLTSRRYGIDASLPYFIPFPFPFHLVGTFGAFIRIRSPFPDRRALFDVGIAGPLAGFAAALPVLVLGVLEAHLVPARDGPEYIRLGLPLLMQWATDAVHGPREPGTMLLLGPLGLAAWFGLFLTALNLIPVGQLDGGHVTYALFGRRAHLVSRAGLLASVLLVAHRPSWLVWSVLLLLLARRGHPPTMDDLSGLGRGRRALAVVGAVVFALCFTPSPVVVTWPEFLAGLAELWRLLVS